MTIGSLLFAALWLAAPTAAQSARAVPGPNLARHRPYTLSPTPNYYRTVDAGDARQLTDGRYETGHLWLQRGAVGWAGADLVDITLDLGIPQPIRGCSFSTAGGDSGVGWPVVIQVLASDDGQTWVPGGDLVALAAKSGLPPGVGYSQYRFVADDLRLHGRYFRLLVAPTPPFVFCDEIEVYGGRPALLPRSPAEGIADLPEFLCQVRVTAGVRRRLLVDLEALRGEAQEASVPAAAAAWAGREADRLTAEAYGPLGPFPPLYRAIHPLNDLHRRIYAVRAFVKREGGAPEFTVWHTCPWDLLDPMELPAGGLPRPKLSVALMLDEYRAEAINVSNLGEREIEVRVRCEGQLPGAPDPDYLTVHQVEWVETKGGLAAPDALPVAPRSPEGGWRVSVPAGLTRQIWLTFHPTDVPPGAYDGRLVVTPEDGLGGGRAIRVPLHLLIAPLHMPPKLTCSLGLWDYTCPGAYDLRGANIEAAIANMRSHYVDTPWTTAACVAWPDGFDAEGRLLGRLDWTRFDDWVAAWRGATYYAVFLNVGVSFRGVSTSDPRFPAGVAAWMHAWVAHLRELGVEPRQLLLLLLDEPKAGQEGRFIAWARAIKTAEPEVVIWEDAAHAQPEEPRWPAMFAVGDVICPSLRVFDPFSEPWRRTYAELRRSGQGLWLSQSTGPAKTNDPYYYYRLQAWYCFRYGAVGSGFWAYGDAGGAGTSWNELRSSRMCHSPVYLEPTGVTDGKHFEAVREGLEDYEYLVMLRKHAYELDRRGQPAAGRQARDLLSTALNQVCGPPYDPSRIPWTVAKDRTAADRLRVAILARIAHISGEVLSRDGRRLAVGASERRW